MLYMVVERFDAYAAKRIYERFVEKGRMLPAEAVFVASWITDDGMLCYQLMDAPDADVLAGWAARWDDLMHFEIRPVQTSAEFWKRFAETVSEP